MNMPVKSVFRELLIDEKNLVHARPYLRADPPGLIRALNLADSAVNFFTGYFPIGFPYFGDSLAPLPWADTYWYESEDRLLPRFAAATSIECVARTMLRLESVHGPLEQCAITWLEGQFCKSPFAMVQNLAVEALIHVDRYLVHIRKRRNMQAIECLGDAYERIIDATVEAARLVPAEMAAGYFPEAAGQLGRTKPDRNLH